MSEMTLEQARMIVADDNERESARRKAVMIQEARGFLGRFFKHEQRDWSPDRLWTGKAGVGDGRWWVYVTPTDVNDWGQLSFLVFERRPDHVVEVRMKALDCGTMIPALQIGGDLAHGWVEMAASEWRGAVREMMREVEQALLPPEK